MTVQLTSDESLEQSSKPLQGLQRRIDATFMRDRLAAIAFLVVLWTVIFFVLLEVHSYIANGAVEIVCWVAAFLLVLFNTTSITAMIRHYAQDKDHIYSVDIRHLDAGR